MQTIEAIHDAVQLGTKLYKEIDQHKLPKTEAENFKYLGQILRSMDFILSDERNREPTK